MSTLVAQTISNGTISTSTANVINGAKAWVNFNGTGTVAIRASYNVSSITDNGTGNYTINFTNAFADANYGVNFSAGDGSTTGAGAAAIYTQTTTTSRVFIFNTAGSAQDYAYVSASYFR
jgi:hypothetical protein